ncbi:TetR/AcrR family transcriptional regulator [Actinocrispum sp. NPDC049592]|uniref:TetR/AcrR family transcriptional regulator n=1 Tax=Actinocrispum sp. NPDC049592 TaxID=3154835 RepID=UPI00341C0C60
MSQPDVRVRRTRKLLRAALVDLIGERGFERVTVGQITERAMISRAAFYRAYRDKYQLAEQVFDEAMADMLTSTADRRRRWVGFFEHIAAYDGLYGPLLGGKGTAWFAEHMRSALGEMSAQHLPPGAGGLTPKVLGAIHVEAISWWLAQGRPTPPADIADHTARLLRAVISAELHGKSSERHPKVLPPPSP